MRGKPIAFVIMPFGAEFDGIFEQLIVPALPAYEVIRADSRLDQRNILQKIVTGISAASLVIADLTTLNPNVMYELGIAHTLRKPTIMLAQAVAELPFDVRSYPVHIYSTQFQHAMALSERLNELGERHIDGAVQFGSPVGDFLPVMVEASVSQAEIDATAAASGVAEDQGDYGRLDFEADMQHHAGVAGEQLRKFAALTSTLAENVVAATPALAAARRSSAPGSALEAKRIANDIADQLERYSDTVESDVAPVFHESLEHVTVALTWVTTPGATTNETELRELGDAMEQINTNVDSALNGVQQFRNSVPAVRGQTRELNRAATKTEQSLDIFLNELMLAKAYFARLRARFGTGASG